MKNTGHLEAIRYQYYCNISCFIFSGHFVNILCFAIRVSFEPLLILISAEKTPPAMHMLCSDQFDQFVLILDGERFYKLLTVSIETYNYIGPSQVRAPGEAP